MTLSGRTKESIKTALAMTIAYAIALSMDWDKPYWAGFAVAFVSLATIGQSFNKAALRMFGTVVGTIVALTLIALYAQDRWPFIIMLSVWIGVCTYMMAGSKHQYFWHVCGFVSVVVCMDGGPDSANAFQIAIVRAQETSMGILVYSLVAIFLWPSSSRSAFETAAASLVTAQYRLYQAYLALLQGNGDSEGLQALKTQELQAQTRFNQLLDAAEGDSYEVRERRQAWRRYQEQVTEMGKTLERWHDSFSGQQDLDMQRLLPNLAAFGDELDRRFEQIGQMLANQAPTHQPGPVELSLDKQAAARLSGFQRAALAISLKRLRQLDALSRLLFGTVVDLRDFGTPDTRPVTAITPPVHFIPDPDRLQAAGRILLVLWITWFAIIYNSGIPGGTGLLSMAVPIGMALITMPQLPVSKAFKPAFISTLLSGCLYIFVMPQLSSFMGLGLMIFVVTFAICYLFAEPQQMLGRTFGLAMFVVIASISNQQSYNFLTVANTAMMFPIIFIIIIASAYIPFSPRPEQVMLRLLRRFFRSSEYLLSDRYRNSKDTPAWLVHWKNDFHSRELASLPQKIGVWAAHIDPDALPGTTREQVQYLVSRLQILTYRLQELLEARKDPQSPELVQEFLGDFLDWRQRVQETLERLSQNPGSAEQAVLRSKLDDLVERLERRIREAMDNMPAAALDASEGEHFYRILGAYRGVSEALVDYAGSTDRIDWSRWHEERFA